MNDDEKLLSRKYSFADKDTDKIIPTIRPLVGELFGFKGGGVGILDRQSKNFVFLQTQSSPWISSLLEPVFLKHHALSFFYNQLRTTDCQFVDDSVAQTLRFLRELPSSDYHRYRLTLDLSLQNADKKYIRFMCHIVFLPPLEGCSTSFCIIRFYQINFNCSYTKPLRCFCQVDNLKRILFHTGEGSMPLFSMHRRRIFELLALGKVAKEIAVILNRAERTIDNTLAKCRGRLQLTNTNHLLHYVRCFGCL